VKRNTQSARIIAASGPAPAQVVHPVRKKWPLVAGAIGAVLVVIAALAYFSGWFSRNRIYTQSELNPKQLTFNSAEDPVAQTSISPDGKYLLYADLEGLHLKLIATGEIQSLPVPDAFCFR
jgi:hypothetical protein